MVHICVFDRTQSALVCAHVHKLMHVPMCPFACMHISVCALHRIWSFFFYVLKAIHRVTFQKPWRAALLSVCVRLCDSAWVEKAQGHISGPLPIMELHSLQMISLMGRIWRHRGWKKVTQREETVNETNTWTPMRVCIYINTLMLSTVILWQAKGFPL